MRYNFIIKGTTNKTWGLQKQKWQWRLETFPDVIDGTFSYKVGHLSYLTLAIHNESSHVLSDTFCIAILVVLASRTIKTVKKRENSQAIKITLAWFNRCSDQNTVFFNKKRKCNLNCSCQWRVLHCVCFLHGKEEQQRAGAGQVFVLQLTPQAADLNESSQTQNFAWTEVVAKPEPSMKTTLLFKLKFLLAQQGDV